MILQITTDEVASAQNGDHHVAVHNLDRAALDVPDHADWVISVNQTVIGSSELGKDPAAKSLDKVLIEILKNREIQDLLVEVIVDLSL